MIDGQHADPYAEMREAVRKAWRPGAPVPPILTALSRLRVPDATTARHIGVAKVRLVEWGTGRPIPRRHLPGLCAAAVYAVGVVLAAARNMYAPEHERRKEAESLVIEVADAVCDQLDGDPELLDATMALVTEYESTLDTPGECGKLIAAERHLSEQVDEFIRRDSEATHACPTTGS